MDTTKAIDHLFFYCTNVEDPRRPPPTQLHALAAILLIAILGTMCGAHNGVDSEQWGASPQAWLSECLELPHGMPSHDTCGRVCALRDSESPPQALVSWMSALAQRGQESMALEGTTMRRSLDRSEGQGPMHGVSAWAARQELGLAQGKGEATSQAITALPALVALRNLEGRVVTIEARGWHVDMARQSIDQGGEYVLR